MSAVFGLDQPLDARIKAAKQENKKRKPHNVNAAVDQHNKKKQKKQQGGNQNQHKGKKKELKSLPNIRVTVINDKANTQKKQQPVQKKQHLAGKPKSQNSVQGQKKHGPLTTKKLSTGKNVETQKKAQPLETSVNVKVWNVKHDISSVDFSNVFKTIEGFKSASINLDAQGKSLGTGVITFSSRALATQFFQEYDGVDLDGQPLKLEL